GHVSLQLHDGKYQLAQDLQIKNGYLQGQSTSLIKITAFSNAFDSISINVSATDIRVIGAGYDQLNLAMTVSSGNLYFQNLALTQGRKEIRQILTGSFPLYSLWDKTRDDQINLRLRLRGEDLVLLTPFLAGTEIASSGNIDISLRGSPDKPLLSAARLDLTNTYIGMDNPYIQGILVRRSDLRLQDNELRINNLEISLLSGEHYTPALNLSGLTRLSEWSLLNPEKIVLQTDLQIQDIKERLAISNLYAGDFELRDAGLSGDLIIPLSVEARAKTDKLIRANEPLGPLLTGSASFANGSLYLAAVDKPVKIKDEKVLSVLLNIDLGIKNDVRVLSTDSLLASNLLGQINISLRDNNPPVRINGSTNYLHIDGRIYLDDGYISFINRKFTLLSLREQEKYFQTNPARRPQDNYIEFTETDRFTMEPHLAVVAQTTVYDTQIVTGSEMLVSEDIMTVPQTITTETDYLVFIDGSIFDLSSVTFEKYKKENMAMVLDGEPYVLKDKITGQTIDQYRFQELTYAISPPLLRSALALARGTGT
ncbi:hypothetical protein RDn1_332, partial [Candidatus Termititenax dinenymphae]